jgi:hypothetical protein
VPSLPHLKHASNSDEAAVAGALRGLRWQIRWYVLLEALLYALLAVGALFWLGLVVDWLFEPSPGVRRVVNWGVGLGVAWIIAWWGFRRLMVRLSDSSMALLVERKYPELADRMSTAVDLSAPDTRQELHHPELVVETKRAAAQVARELDVRSVLNFSRLRYMASALVLTALSVFVLAVLAPHVWQIYTDRIALSGTPWPRSVELSVEGFVDDGRGNLIRKVARNSDVPLVVKARLTEGKIAPERVSIAYRWRNGQAGRDELVRIGDAHPPRDTHQRFEYLFERINDTVEFRVRGGDDQLRNLRIEVVERPKVTNLEFTCIYPSYLGREPRTLIPGPRVEIPEGTTLEVSGEQSTPIHEVAWRVTTDDEGAVPLDSKTTDFTRTLTVPDGRMALEITLVDKDGIESQEPFTVAVEGRSDSPPQVEVQRDGIGLAVTPVARIPLEVRLEDDYALDRAWMEVRVDDGEPRTLPVVLAQQGLDLANIQAAIDLRELAEPPAGSELPPLQLAPGSRFNLTVVAADRYDLTQEPHHGASRVITFEVVTPQDLVARLSSSEQSLRQTFEAIADKLLVLYGSLEAIDVETVALVDADEQAEPPTGGAEEPTEGTDESLTRQAGRLAENMRQMADETKGVAAGFADLRAQLDNNRIDNTQLADRLGNKIAIPLERLGVERMAEVGDQIAAIRDDATLDAARQGARLCIAEVERLLREMQGLEDYSELVAMLRDIIRQQEQVHMKTKEKQRSELRNLLLE